MSKLIRENLTTLYIREGDDRFWVEIDHCANQISINGDEVSEDEALELAEFLIKHVKGE